MQPLSHLKDRLALHGLAPNKSLGQNFLIDHNLTRKLLDHAEQRTGPLAGQTILEIGPGAGALTEEILARGARLIACELDAGLVRLLTEELAEPLASGALTLIHDDCLDGKRAINPAITEALAGQQFRLLANLPYAAGSPVMAILASDPRCRGQFVTIQREVADRLRAQPGTRNFGELSAIVQATCTVERIATLPPECFWPRPKITSEMVAILPRDTPLTDNPRALATLCDTLFTKRRKQLRAILGKDFPFPTTIDPTNRPEQLTLEHLIELASLAANQTPQSPLPPPAPLP